jgi:cellulose synthase (UDP-forming)
MDNPLIKHRLLFLSSFLMTGIYLFWRIFFTLPNQDDGHVAIVFGFFLLMAEIMGALEYLSLSYFLSDVHVPRRSEPPAEWYPDIDVFIATYNESVEILQKTINACLKMEYVPGRCVNIYVCDDGKRDAIAELCQKMGVYHLTRPDNRDAKSGNYNSALRVTSSPLIVNFDADMMPRRNFLMSVVPYFYVSPEEAKERELRSLAPKKIGFVQTPQRFYNPDLFQFNLHAEKMVPNEQDYFFQEIQLGRNKCNAAICAGSNVIFAREALLEIGGYVTGVVTEDFATGILIQERGYTTYAVPDNVAHGLSPVDLKGLINQRRRWARGCIQTLRKFHFLLSGNMSLQQKLAYWSAFAYWCFPIRRLIYLLSPIVFTLFSIPILHCGLAEILIIALPSYLLQFISLRKLSNGIRSYALSSIYENVLFPSLLPSIVMELLGIKKLEFHVTPKNLDRKENQYIFQALHAFPHVVLTTLNIVSIFYCIYSMFATGLPFYLFIVFWLLLNTYTTGMSTFFMLGRKIQRDHERFEASVVCKIAWEEQNILTKTVDISERGFAIILAIPHYIPEETVLDITLETADSQAHVKAAIVNVIGEKKGYRYAFRFLEIDDLKEKNSLYAIIYDREPALPSKLLDDNSSLRDFIRNIQLRFSRFDLLNRRQPRIKLGVTANVSEDKTVRIMNFSYELVLLSFGEFPPSDKVVIPLSDEYAMECVIFQNRGEGIALYKLENLSEIVYQPAFAACMERWYMAASAEQDKAPITTTISYAWSDNYVLDEKVTLV